MCRSANCPHMPKTRTHRVKGAYHYAKRRDGTKYRVYHNGRVGKGSTRKTGNYKRGSYGRVPALGGYITGFGAYKRGRRGINTGTQVPSVVNSKTGFILRHKEYIGDVPASQAFLLASLAINPGQGNTFPWLSQIAENFEEWVPRGITFMFKTTSSNAVVSTAANAALGTVVMATEYNVANPVFGNKQQMENYEGAVSCDPSRSMLHLVESSKSQNPLGVYFVRTGAVPAGSDARFYDMGLFQIATTGMQTNGNLIGELWVSYEIELRKPRILTGQPLQNEPAVDHFQIPTTGLTPSTPFSTQTSALISPTTGSSLGGLVSGGIVPAASQPQGGIIPVLDGNGNATGSFGASTANTYYFPPGITRGVFMLQYSATYGTAGTANWAPNVTYTNCALLDAFAGNTVPGVANTGTAGVTTTILTTFVAITKGNAKIVLTGTTGTFANPQSADLFVTQMPFNLN